MREQESQLLSSRSGTDKELLVTGRYVIKRPMRGKSPKANPRLPPKRDRRQSSQRPKLQTKRSQTLVPQIKTNIRNAMIPSQQKLFRLFHPHPRNKLVRSLPKCFRKQPVEMKGRKTGVAGCVVQRNPLAIESPQIVPSPQEARERDTIAQPNITPERKLRASQRASHSPKM
jgi:hypothetical protein